MKHIKINISKNVKESCCFLSAEDQQLILFKIKTTGGKNEC